MEQSSHYYLKNQCTKKIKLYLISSENLFLFFINFYIFILNPIYQTMGFYMGFPNQLYSELKNLI